MRLNNTFKFKSLWGSVRGSLLIRPLTGALCWTVDASSDVVSSRFRSLLSISLSCWWCSCCRIFSICVPSNNSTPLLPHPLPCRYYRPTNDLCSPTRCRKRALWLVEKAGVTFIFCLVKLSIDRNRRAQNTDGKSQTEITDRWERERPNSTATDNRLATVKEDAKEHI